MKRSEAVARLFNRLTQIQGVDPKTGDVLYPDDDYLIHCMLDEMETMGMLPPTFKYWNSPNPKDVNERGIPNDLRTDPFNGDEMNYWEPE